MDQKEESKKIWLDNYMSEVRFWEEWFRTKGSLWPDDYIHKTSHNVEIADPYKKYIDILDLVDVNILDVGAGPLTILGKIHPTKNLHITAVDPLAEEYDKLLEKYGVIPPVRTQYSPAEEVAERFGHNSFDFVCATNCLDHSFEPLLAIRQMLYTVKEGGHVLLFHAENEAQTHDYGGLHQWNFTIDGNDFWIKSKHAEVNVTSELSGLAEIICYRHPPNVVVVVLRKRLKSELTSPILNLQKVLIDVFEPNIVTDIECICFDNEMILTYPRGRHSCFLNKPAQVTACIPVFNAGKNFIRCLESAINQTFKDIHIVIVDNNSTDDTFTTACHFAYQNENITVYRNVRNIGRIQNWNKCLSLSFGEYVKPVMINDFLAPACIAELVAVFESNPSIVLARSSLSMLLDDGITRFLPLFSQSLFIKGEDAIKYCLESGNIAAGPTAQIFRNNIIRQHGIHFRDKYSWASDFDFAMQLFELGDFSYLCQPLYVFDSTAHRFFSQSNLVLQFEEEVMVRLDAVARGSHRQKLSANVLKCIEGMYLQYCQQVSDASSMIKLNNALGQARNALNRNAEHQQPALQVDDIDNRNDLDEYLQLPAGKCPPKFTRKSICLVTNDIKGLTRGGGTAGFVATIAETLAIEGHAVTVLVDRTYPPDNGTFEQWIAYYAQKNINITVLKGKPDILFHGDEYLIISYEIYEWLKCHHFDIIQFNDYEGMGFYTALAKRHKLAFIKTLICVVVHSPHLYLKEASLSFIDNIRSLEIDYIEKSMVENADVVITPSQYMLGWMKSNGFKLPRDSFVQQNILPPYVFKLPKDYTPMKKPITELVFFGLLQDIKGIALFCDLVEKLSKENTVGFTITFLGKEAFIDDLPCTSYLQWRAIKWNVPWQIVSDLGPAEALQYLQSGNRLAVMASILDNSPYSIIECIQNQIPFITSKVGGIPELIHAADIDKVCFTRSLDGLYQKVTSVLTEGAFTVRPRIRGELKETSWKNWYNQVDYKNTPTDDTDILSTQQPFVSVIITHYNRAQYLRQAVTSILEQDYENIELIVVDDGSRLPEAIACLSQLESELCNHNFRVIRQENKYLGAARNTGARHAKGDYVAYLDDDDYAKPNRISTQLRSALLTGADIVLAGIDEFTGSNAPNSNTVPRAKWVPVGPSVAVGLFKNCYGAVPALIKKDLFDKIGGFTEVVKLGFEDWEYWARAVTNGYKLELVPEALNWYRITPSSMLQTTPHYLNHQIAIQPYLDAVPDAIKPVIKTAMGMYQKELQRDNTIYNLRLKEKLNSTLVLAAVNISLGKDDEAEKIVKNAISEASETKKVDIILDVWLNGAAILANSQHYNIARQMLFASMDYIKELHTYQGQNYYFMLDRIDKIIYEIKNNQLVKTQRAF